MLRSVGGATETRDDLNSGLTLYSIIKGKYQCEDNRARRHYNALDQDDQLWNRPYQRAR